MKKWIIPIAIGTALTFTSRVYGQQIDRSARPTAAKAPVINIKDSEVFTTSNGITVVLSENHNLPRVSFNLVMGGTPISEGPKAGVNDLMGELVLSGTTNRPKDVLDKEVDYIGATLTADGSSIYLACLTKHLDKALDLMKDVTMNAAFPQSEFDRIKKQAESGLLSAKSNPNAMAANAEKRANFAGHPYGDVMSETTLAAINREDIVTSFKRTFTPQGAYLVIVGDITRAAAEQLAEQYFGQWKGEPVYKANLGSGLKNKGNRIIFVNKPGAVQSTIAVSFTVDMKPGDKNQLPLDVMNQILGGSSFGARLMQNLRENKAYTYGAYSDLQVTRYGSWLSASGNFRNDVTDSAITQFLYEFNRISEGYVTDEELSLTRSAMAGSFARSLENPQTIARFALNIIQNGLPADYYKNYLKRLEAIDKDAVLLMAQSYLKSGYNIVVVGNEAVLDKIRRFDADGVIEKMDAYGNPVIERKAADITTDQLVRNYLFAVTQTSSEKAMLKKVRKIKSVEKKIELPIEQMGIVATMTETYVAPNKTYTSIDAMGMNMMTSVYNGTTGSTGSMGKKEPMTADELASIEKTAGLFPELSCKKGGLDYELKGIEVIDGKEVYVVRSQDGNSEQYDYYAKDTYLKVKTLSISQKDGQTMESTITYGDYKDVSGILFPHATSLSQGEMIMSGTVKSIIVNGKVDTAVFK